MYIQCSILSYIIPVYICDAFRNKKINNFIRNTNIIFTEVGTEWKVTLPCHKAPLYTCSEKPQQKYNVTAKQKLTNNICTQNNRIIIL